jgi:hypothetical protein
MEVKQREKEMQRGGKKTGSHSFLGTLPKGGSPGKLKGASLGEVPHNLNRFLNEEKFQTCIPSAGRKRVELLPNNPYKSSPFPCMTKQPVVSRIQSCIYRCSKCSQPISTLLCSAHSYAWHCGFPLLQRKGKRPPHYLTRKGLHAGLVREYVSSI